MGAESGPGRRWVRAGFRRLRVALRTAGVTSRRLRHKFAATSQLSATSLQRPLPEPACEAARPRRPRALVVLAAHADEHPPAKTALRARLVIELISATPTSTCGLASSAGWLASSCRQSLVAVWQQSRSGGQKSRRSRCSLGSLTSFGSPPKGQCSSTWSCDKPGTVIGPVPCIKCSDGSWHCLGGTYPPCPPGFSCAASFDAGDGGNPLPQCATCTNGTGSFFRCVGRGVVSDPVTCSE
jgi:hypothetical protein